MSKGWEIVDRKNYVTREHIKAAIRRLYSDKEMGDIESKSFDEISKPKERLAKFLSVQMGLIDGSMEEEVGGFCNIKNDKIKNSDLLIYLNSFVNNEVKSADSLSKVDKLNNIEEIRFWCSVVESILGLQTVRIR